MIGNDIIALNELPVESESRFCRRINKVCTDLEIKWLYSLEKPARNRAFWKLWALKEAAWKADYRRGGMRLFNPHRYNCQLDLPETEHTAAEENWLVTSSRNRMKCKLNMTPSFIHALAQHDTGEYSIPYWDSVSFTAKNPVVQSEELRRAVRKGLGRFFDLNRSDIRIIKDMRGVPLLFACGAELPFVLSLSHHGHWGAWSIAYHNERCN